MTAFIGGATFLASPLLRESPRWLVARGRIDEARAVLLAVRGYGLDDAEVEIDEIRAASAEGSKVAAPSIMQVLTNRHTRAPVLVACFLQMAQQL